MRTAKIGPDLRLAPSLLFTLSLQSAFYTQSAYFYPWSTVCSLQSAFYTDRLKPVLMTDLADLWILEL